MKNENTRRGYVQQIIARDPNKLWELLNKGWLKDLSEKNRAIYNHPTQAGLCYDAERNLFYTEEDTGPIAVCSCCNKLYNIQDEPKEISEAKIRVCPECFKK